MPEKEQKQVNRLKRMIATNFPNPNWSRSTKIIMTRIRETFLTRSKETQPKPNYQNLKKIADALKVTVDELEEATKHGGKSSSYRKKPRLPRFEK